MKQLVILLFIVCFISPRLVYASSVSYEGTITKIIQEKTLTFSGKKQLYQQLEIVFTTKDRAIKKVVVENGTQHLSNPQRYHQNDKVIPQQIKDKNSKIVYYISDYNRKNVILLLFGIFVLLAILIGKWRGILSLCAMIISFVVIVRFILPQLLYGANPVVTAILGSLIIIPITFFLSHGFHAKTVVAMIGTLISLILTGLIAQLMVFAAHLTGFASEEAGFLQVAKQGTIDMRGLLLAGIIIGSLGVLDDITVSQSAIVFQLKSANEKFGFFELYKKAMQVGKDHISSMINTLILVYTGAALPLLLLFINNPQPIVQVISSKLIADEIIRTLVGSIGLIISVPITTYLAALVASKR